eukprot:TRINITY_DN13554_c0_g1_i1.p1 TRINITY_DN13554_c0_g1~~TRINITY_DN13554_c0_g1_i1.p1  ORF type:complete len:164 (+),score=32.20 TRINITY_DN13554_c0_g1_i1:55-546(+)
MSGEPETLTDYPELPEFEEELLELCKTVFRSGKTDTAELMFELATYYSKKSGLTLHRTGTKEEVKQMQRALQSALQAISELHKGLLASDMTYFQIVAELSAQIPTIFEKYELPPPIITSLVKHLRTKEVGRLAASVGPFSDPEVNRLIDECVDLPLGSLLSET